MGGSEGGAFDEDAMMLCITSAFINGGNEEDPGGGWKGEGASRRIGSWRSASA